MGKYSRIGQQIDGSACGAACGALQYCLDCKAIPTSEDLGSKSDDYQMQWIISELSKRAQSIASKEDPNAIQAELAKNMYLIAHDFMHRIIDPNFHQTDGKKGSLYLLGGIQINMPRPMPDYFVPYTFQKLTYLEETIDLMEETFKQ